MARWHETTRVRVLLLALVWVMALYAVTLNYGCRPVGERPSVHAFLTHTENIITAGSETLGQAISAGLVDTASQDYAHVYGGLARANVLLDGAWRSYLAGDQASANSVGVIALETYDAIRPALYRLAGVVQ